MMQKNGRFAMTRRLLKMTVSAAAAAAILAGGLVAVQAGELQLYDLSRGKTISRNQALERLGGMRIVLVGEHHNNADHHRAQLQIIRVLRQAGHKVAVGLEMFRSDSRADLDRWVAGGIDEARFKAIYLDNWNYPWKLYAPIFEYARRQKIALVGLNVSRDITAQVALHGFDSLTSAQKGNLEGVTCDVSGEYEAYIRRAYGAHGHGRMDFSRFCQAQLVWDTAMAMNAIAYADSHPDTLLVILAGSGHARKPGIPAQLARRKSWPVAVLLPETAAIFDTAHISSQDADFLILNN
jgi:uncharacterized iron-regulated protein